MPHNMPEADRVRLTHMLLAAREAAQFIQQRRREDLDIDRMLSRAIIHCVQEIGEAAVRVTPETRALAPSLPWNQIVGMRHRLVHAYFNVNLDFVWEVVVRDLPLLIESLGLILSVPTDDGAI